jgi:teichuronic acid exporter
MQEELKTRTVSGIKWSFVNGIVSKAISLAISIVLARLLMPSLYGLIGVVGIFTAVNCALADAGLANALISKKDPTEEDCSTVFYTNLAISAVLCALMLVLAPAISSFFKRPELTGLLRASSVLVVIYAMSSIQKTLLVKKVDFKSQMKAGVISMLAGGAVGITMAALKFGAWSLLAQQMTAGATNCVLLWVYNGWRPKSRISCQSFGKLFGFGWKIMVSGLMSTVFWKGYTVVIGKFYTPEELGYFSKADGVRSSMNSVTGALVKAVSLPTLSDIQDDAPRLRNAYRKFLKDSALISAVIMLGLAACARQMIVALIGEKWAGAGAYLQVLCLAAAVSPLIYINLNILQVKGRSDLYLVMDIIRKALMAAPLLLGIYLNIYWMLAGYVLSDVISVFLTEAFAGRYVDYGIGLLIKDVGPSYLIGLAAASPVLALSFLPWPAYAVLPIQLVVGWAATIGLCELCRREEYLEVKGIFIGEIKRACSAIRS